jgi:two-component system response regulator PilR (NtrC family)
MSRKILIVDDETSMREFLSILLGREGYVVETAADADSALTILSERSFDLIISDVKMPGLDGIALLERVKRSWPDTAVLMITAYSTAEDAVEAMKMGAYDYIAKPFKVEELKILVRNALEKLDLKKENFRLRKEVRDRFSGFVGKSRTMRDLYSLIEKVAASTSSILIVGESGTGKELTARALHEHSPRKDKPFVAVNCGAIPDTLIESELFGHKKGSFTGAIADKPGLFEQAEHGTLFLDEVGEIPLLLQAKLLRVLQEKEFRRVGGSESLKSDVRIVAASNRDLEEQLREGTFREDLFYRLNVIMLRMPPLRERAEDIVPLIEHFFRKFTGKECNGPVATPEALKVIMSYPFPGNVRELENMVERCTVLGEPLLDGDSLPHQMLSFTRRAEIQGVADLPEEGLHLESYLDAIEKRYLTLALQRRNGVKKRAAELLGLTFRSFRYRLAKFGMDDE